MRNCFFKWRVNGYTRIKKVKCKILTWLITHVPDPWSKFMEDITLNLFLIKRCCKGGVAFGGDDVLTSGFKFQFPSQMPGAAVWRIIVNCVHLVFTKPNCVTLTCGPTRYMQWVNSPHETNTTGNIITAPKTISYHFQLAPCFTPTFPPF